MDATAVIGSAATVLSFLTFVAIVAWAYSRRRQRQFEDAANAPFALPDDGGPLDAPAAADGPGARR
ncbi:MAG: CcoQ/FixQ family Cbb3-type cytochrome c oxidase assembly chaperone [Burkholderiales bacterium]|jgi:cytochrome c oxidase cbb3-type subunit 4|nr:CcoQ/FixQ family Cbb3-type cytochrome c oxidase assembly chaperone [Burkholderiales bacterium]